MNKKLLISCASLFIAGASYAQFTAGDIAVFQTASATANNTTGAVLDLSSTVPAQTTPANTYTINGTTGANVLRFSGSATSTCYLSSTDDNSLLVFTGLNSTTTSGNSNLLLPRGVGTLNASGTFNMATTYTGGSGDQPRCATSTNNSNWYIADQGGLYTNGASTVSPSGNFRSIRSFGGIVYVSAAAQIGTIAATTGSTVTALPGLTVANLVDFYMIQSGTNGTTYDVLYVLTGTTANANVISKYSLVSGSWTANGTYTTTFGGFSLLARSTGSGATLFSTSGGGATAANSVIKLQDVAGFNSTISIITANNVTLYTTPAGTTLKGIANAPTSTTPLAIKLSNFAAKNQGNTNLITWNLATENKGDYVILDRSNDGKTFTTLTKVNANGSTPNYQFTDLNPTEGVNYYRLCLVSVDGSKTYSNVVSVNNAGIVNNAITIFPNPVTGTSFNVILNKAATSTFVITVTNEIGKTITTQTIAPNSNGAPTVIQLPANISNGVYYINAINGGNQYHQKIVVSK
jgi:hypothetical protein